MDGPNWINSPTKNDERAISDRLTMMMLHVKEVIRCRKSPVEAQTQGHEQKVEMSKLTGAMVNGACLNKRVHAGQVKADSMLAHATGSRDAVKGKRVWKSRRCSQPCVSR
jgi:hypothetical protein